MGRSTKRKGKKSLYGPSALLFFLQSIINSRHEAHQDMANDGRTVSRQQNGHLFLPRRFQRRAILIWLKRVHAWTGFWGALLFVLLGVSGILLDHRASVMHLDTGSPIEVASLERVLPAGEITSPEELTAWMKREFNISQDPAPVRRAPPRAVAFNGQPQEQAAEWNVRFSGPNAAITATYLPEANLLRVSQTQTNFWGIIKSLHKGGSMTVPWILLMDASGGALVFMSLSGILLWTRMHGPRIAAVVLLFGSTAVTLALIFPMLIGATVE